MQDQATQASQSPASNGKGLDILVEEGGISEDQKPDKFRYHTNPANPRDLVSLMATAERRYTEATERLAGTIPAEHLADSMETFYRLTEATISLSKTKCGQVLTEILATCVTVYCVNPMELCKLNHLIRAVMEASLPE